MSPLIEANVSAKDNDFSFDAYGSVFEITTRYRVPALVMNDKSLLEKLFPGTKTSSERHLEHINGKDREDANVMKTREEEIKSILGY